MPSIFSSTAGNTHNNLYPDGSGSCLAFSASVIVASGSSDVWIGAGITTPGGKMMLLI